MNQYFHKILPYSKGGLLWKEKRDIRKFRRGILIGIQMCIRDRTIPKDFSKNATTLTEKNAKKMMLYYETNPGQNYIASKMSETAVSKIQTNIREKITTQYTETVFEQLGTIGDGFVEAADGALQITDGTDQLLDGNGQLQDGIETLKDGTLSLIHICFSLSAFLSGQSD